MFETFCTVEENQAWREEMSANHRTARSLKAKPKKMKRHQEKPHPYMIILVKQVWRVKFPQASQNKKANRAKKPKKKCHQGLPPNAIKGLPKQVWRVKVLKDPGD